MAQDNQKKNLIYKIQFDIFLLQIATSKLL